MKEKIIKLKRVWFEDEQIFIETEKGVIKSHPLKWFPRLLDASEKERGKYRISPLGIHWEDLDEDLSIEGFFTFDKDGMEAKSMKWSGCSMISLKSVFLNLHGVPALAQRF